MLFLILFSLVYLLVFYHFHQAWTTSNRPHKQKLRPARFSSRLLGSSAETCPNADNGWKVGAYIYNITLHFHSQLQTHFSMNLMCCDLPLTGQVVVIQLLDWIMRGIAQVIFVNNPISGLLITAALFLQNPWWALNGLLGTLVSTVSAFLLGLNRSGGISMNASSSPSLLLIFSGVLSAPSSWAVSHPQGRHIGGFIWLQWNLGGNSDGCFLSQRRLVLVAVPAKCVHDHVVVSGDMWSVIYHHVGQ